MTWESPLAARNANTPFGVGTASLGALSFAVALVTTPVAGTGSSAAPAVQLRRGAVRELKVGRLLVASRNLPDPNFAATVVLLADFNAEGALGLIVNRPTKVTLATILPGVEAPGSAATAFFGGPVSVSSVLALLRFGDAAHRQPPRRERRVSRQHQRCAEGDDRSRRRASAAPCVCRLRRTGTRQLEHETAEGSWFVLDGDADVVFDPDPESSWRRQIRRAEALSADGEPEPRMDRMSPRDSA